MAAMPSDTNNRPDDPLDLDIPQKPAGESQPGNDLAQRVETLESEKAILQDKFLRAVR